MCIRDSAKRIGVQETVLHRGDIVTECAHSNVSILKDGVLYSHPNDEFILQMCIRDSTSSASAVAIGKSFSLPHGTPICTSSTSPGWLS